MNIQTINSQGYFKGDFDYLERAEDEVVKDSINSFYGKLKYKFNYKRIIHPLDPNKNRTYDGKIYIVDRHDMPLHIENIKPYLKCEFTIKHYREMGAIEFTVPKMLKDSKFIYPSSFVLYKSMGFQFEPYQSVKEVVFKERGRVDR